MIDLIKIDICKYKLKKQFLYFLIANIIMALAIFGILSVGDLTDSAPVIIDIFVKPVFIVWEAVLICMVVIDEFKNKTVLMLYTYPLDKKKLIIAKVIVVISFSLAGIIMSQILLNVVFYGLHQILPAISYHLVWQQVIAYLFSSIMVILLGLIPLAVGLVSYSTIGTMVTSIAIVSVGSTSGLGFDNLLSQIGFVCVLGVIGIVAAFITIQKMFKRDIIV